MPHGDGVGSVKISSDGRHLATLGRDGNLRVFTVPEAERPLEDLTNWTAIASGLSLDDADNLLTVDAKPIDETWASLRGRYTAVAWAIAFVIDPDSNELTVDAIPTTLDVGNHARASAVNDSNEIVGRAISGAPMYWSGTTSHTLKGLSPDNSRGWAWGINNHGVVVGESWHYEYKGKQISWEGQVAAVWPTPASDPILLVPIQGSVWGGTVSNEARAINDAGVILINHASRATLAYP